MKCFICDDMPGVFLKGSAVVFAENEDEGRQILIDVMRADGLNYREPFTLKEVPTNQHAAFIIWNGDY